MAKKTGGSSTFHALLATSPNRFRQIFWTCRDSDSCSTRSPLVAHALRNRNKSCPCRLIRARLRFFLPLRVTNLKPLNPKEKTLKKILTAAFSAAALALALASLSQPAAAQDVSIWRPTTAAGGAPVDPNFWNNQAAVRHNGGMGNTTNVTIAPTTSTYNDYSTPVTNVTGGQTNVNASGHLTNGGTFTVNTGRDTTFSGDSQQNNTTTNASTTATLGDGSTVTTNTSSTNNGPGTPE